MRMRAWLSTGLLLSLTVAHTLPAQSAPGDSTSRAIDRLFESVRSAESPGCGVGVSRRGEVVLQRQYGMANLETGTAIDTGTVFHVASIAKQFTAMAILLLERDGKLSLDDDVRHFVPELPDYGARITVRHLLTHTSGLRDFFELLIIGRGRFEEDRITDADVLDIVTRQKALNFAPGTEYLYSNTGYALAALIVQRVSGRPLRDFAAERIFVPLGMTATQFHEDFTALVPHRAWGYARRGSAWRSSMPNYDVVGPTNLLSTVGDLLAWSAHLDDPRAADQPIVRMMSTSAVLTNGDSTNYGLGLSLVTERGVRIVEHEGGDPGFRSYLGRVPDQRLAVAVLCNTRSVNPVGLGRRVIALYLDSLMTGEPGFRPPGPAPVDVRALERRAGVYFRPSTQEVVELTVRNGELFTARQGGVKLIPIDSSRFVLADQPLELRFEAAERASYVARPMVPGRHPWTFEWRPSVAPSHALFAPYAGRYYSEELASTYTVTSADSTITLKTGTAPGLQARSVFPDAFVSGQYVIQFTRHGDRVTGFEISHPRARRVRFALDNQ